MNQISQCFASSLFFREAADCCYSSRCQLESFPFIWFLFPFIWQRLQIPERGRGAYCFQISCCTATRATPEHGSPPRDAFSQHVSKCLHSDIKVAPLNRVTAPREKKRKAPDVHGILKDQERWLMCATTT